MSANTPRGFVEHRNLGGRVSPIARMRKVKADGVSGTNAKFAGDPVILVSGNTVALWLSDTSSPPVGVIRSVLTDATFHHQARPKTFAQPDNGPFIDSSAAGWVEVNEDPDQTYLLNAASTVTSTHIGQFIASSAGAPNTAVGRAGGNGAMGTATNTATTTEPFQIIEIAPNNLDGIVGGENNQDIEVRIASHAFRTGALDKVR